MSDPEAVTQGKPTVLTSQEASDVRIVAKGGAVQILGQIGSQLLGLVFIAVATRLLSKGDYGLYRLTFQQLAVIGQVGLLGFNFAAMRFITMARARGDPSGVRGAALVSLWGTAITSSLVFIALELFAQQLASLFAGGKANTADLAMLLRVGAAYVPLFGLMQTLRYCTQAYKNMLPSVIVGNIVQPALRFLLGIGVLALGIGVVGLMWTTVVSVAAGVVLGFYYLRRVFEPQERAASPVQPIWPVLRFAIPQAGASMLGIQSLGLGVIIIGLYRHAPAVAVFGIALSLQTPGSVFLGGIVNIWAPMVSELHERGAIRRLEVLYQTVNRWVVTFSFPVYVALIVMPGVFTHLLAPKFEQAAVVTAILAAGNLFYTATGPTGYVISMTGRPWLNLVNSVAGVAVYIVAGSVVVPAHGAVGMAVVDSVITAVINLVRVVEAKLLVGVQPFGRSFLKPLGASVAMAAALLLWRLLPGGWPVDLAGVAVGGVIYIAVLLALGLDGEERYVWKIIRKRVLRGKRAGGGKD